MITISRNSGKHYDLTSGSSSTKYVRTETMGITVGGATSGSTFDGDVIAALDKILYPYKSPNFSSFSVNSPLTFEVGDTMPSNTYTFSWGIGSAQNILADSIVCNGVSIVGNPGTSEQLLASMTKNIPGSRTFSIAALNSNNQGFSRSLSVYWMYKRYWGVSEVEVLTDAAIKAMSNEYSSSKVKSVVYNCDGGRYFCFAYPSSFGLLTNTVINGLVYQDWVLEQRDFVNDYGVVIPFNIYRSYYKINAVDLAVALG